jgi:hypothetical protein
MCAAVDKSSQESLKAERTAFVSVYVEPAMKERLEELASKNERSLSAQIRLMLGQALGQAA